MIITNGEWLHSFDKYVDYLPRETENPLLIAAIKKFGFFFDESYWYWIGGRTALYVKRAPLWLFPQKRMPSEKSRSLSSSQQSQKTLGDFPSFLNCPGCLNKTAQAKESK